MLLRSRTRPRRLNIPSASPPPGQIVHQGEMGHRHRSAAHQDAGSCWRLIAVEGAIAHINGAAQTLQGRRRDAAPHCRGIRCRRWSPVPPLTMTAPPPVPADIIMEDAVADAHLGAGRPLSPAAPPPCAERLLWKVTLPTTSWPLFCTMIAPPSSVDRPSGKRQIAQGERLPGDDEYLKAIISA